MHEKVIVLRQLTNPPKTQFLRLEGHVARMGDMRNEQNFVSRTEGKRTWEI
jgi:hypothetical protein